MASSSWQTQSAGRSLLPPTLTLAWQRTHNTWGWLCLLELGILGAVLLVCAVPLYTSVTMTAAVRSTLNTSAQNTDIVVRSLPQLVSRPVIDHTTQVLNNELRHTLGPYLEPVQFSLETQSLRMLIPGRQGTLTPNGVNVSLISADLSRAASHLTLLEGSLPRVSGETLQVAVTPQTLDYLHTPIGSVLAVRLTFTDVYNRMYPQVLLLRIVGLFRPRSARDAFWHGNDFAPYLDNGVHLYALSASTDLLDRYTRLSQDAAAHNRVFVSPPSILWYYHLNSSQIGVDDLHTLIAGIGQVQIDNANNPALEHDPYLEQTQTYLPAPAALTGLAERLSVIEFPVISLLVLIVGLILLFIATTVSLFIERQSAAIALLRSRGASRRQILGALLVQGTAMVSIALVAGLPLALLIVRLLVRYILAGQDQNAVNFLLSDPVQVAGRVGLYALLTAVVALLTIVLAAWSAARRDIVALRRETARQAHRPLWQRLRLDILAALIALAGSGCSVYLLNSQVLDSQLYLLLLSPLALLQTLLLLLAALLLLFRFLPPVLRLGAKLAARRKSAAPMVALAQIARAPRQPVRTALLLALASAFAIFSLIFTATQSQRVLDVAGYQAGADFSGSFPAPVYSSRDLRMLTHRYNQIPGVLATSPGYRKQAQAGALLDIPLNFQAVDAATFAQAATWSAQDTTQPLGSLMQALLAQRSTALAQQIVPAIVDSQTRNVLHLGPQATFTLQFPEVATDRPLRLRVLAEVQHIPTPDNLALPGVLVDYTSFASIYTANFQVLSGSAIALNYAWLHTRDDSRSLAQVRSVLTSGEMRLEPIFDRRALQAALFADPIYLTLIGELALGAMTALCLALLGSLMASWLSTRSRLVSFAALRALGATPRQLMSTMAWEQGCIFTAALLLGILVGSLLATFSLPSLVLTSVLPDQTGESVSNASFYAAQFVPPLRVSIPATLWLILGALILACLLTLGMMVRNMARCCAGETLRLSED
jgi:putative ABC transport system permease protein